MILGRVALRKESVDRNAELSEVKHYGKVALRKESVDRNNNNFMWLRISYVALRKESVDRNPIAAFLLMWWQRSLSARRAWIEIPAHCPRLPTCAVALRKESVDRNDFVRHSCNCISRRSPQGERG